MNLLYIVFGTNFEFHAQANFSILSFMVQKKYINRIIVITDNADHYKHLKEENVYIVQIDDQTITDWKGEYGFFWRIKIKGLEYAANIWPDEHLVYLDTDTFLIGNINELRILLNSGRNLMHIDEGKLYQRGTKTENLMWRQVKNRTYEGITINKESSMWNAGVVGISSRNLQSCIRKSLSICDEMCKENVTRRLIEQFALSMALSVNPELLPVDHVIGHYWGNKVGWNKYIIEFFIRGHFAGLSLRDQITEISKINFNKLPYYVKASNTKRRLINIISKIFKDKNIRFIEKRWNDTMHSQILGVEA